MALFKPLVNIIFSVVKSMVVLAFNVFTLVPDKMRVYKSCSRPVAAMIFVIYVDNNGIRHNCEE